MESRDTDLYARLYRAWASPSSRRVIHLLVLLLALLAFALVYSGVRSIRFSPEFSWHTMIAPTGVGLLVVLGMVLLVLDPIRRQATRARSAVKARFHENGECPRCGYTTDRRSPCPECGSPLPCDDALAPEPSWVRKDWPRMWLALLVMVPAAAVCLEAVMSSVDRSILVASQRYYTTAAPGAVFRAVRPWPFLPTSNQVVITPDGDAVVLD